MTEKRAVPNPDPAAIERRLGTPEEQKEKLRDISETSGGQRTEVGTPYDGKGNLQEDVRKQQKKDVGVPEV